jgi:DNA-binding NarL/FixJ family response regulator
MKVFIVDDSRAFRKELINLLSKLKEVEIVGQAQDSVKAMEAIQRLKPDAVILGIPIPGGNGIRLVKNIKKDKLAPIVIILTHYPYCQYRKKYMDAGADFFFDKSTEFEKIIDVFKKLIKNPCGRNLV